MAVSLRAGDLRPDKTVYVTPGGKSVHLSPNCQSTQGAKTRPTEVRKLYRDTPVCGHCLRRSGKYGQGVRKSEAYSTLENTDPDDFPELPGGVE